ncbi:MAG: hypothetical protein LBN33_06975 [Desulfovibrio sp.]|jgi:hypothetical protein|nr:hypothetical protein [Desulfovibrio sp.]
MKFNPSRTDTGKKTARRAVLRGLFALCLLLLLGTGGAALAATVPQAASAVGREMDRQLGSRLGQKETDLPARGVSLSITTPVNINALDEANPLARQMQEEIARWFVQAGYDVQEIRKGADILFEPDRGELLLTRQEELLGNRIVETAALVAGTYVVTPEHVRFNIRILQTRSREVLAMSTVTLPMNREVAFLTRNPPRPGASPFTGGAPIEPTVVTLLP